MCLTNCSHDSQTLAPRTRSNVPSGSITPSPLLSDSPSSSQTSGPDLDSTETPNLPPTPETVETPLSPSQDSDHSLSESDDDHLMTTRVSANGHLDYGNGKNLSPRVLNKPMWGIYDHGDLKDAIAKYVKLNKITDLAEVKDVWAEAWHGYPTAYRWFKNTQKLVAMPLDEFINAVRDYFLGALWPSKVAEMRSKLHMKGTGAGAFANFVGEVQALNIELKDTNYFYDDKQLLALMSDGLIKAFRDDLIYERLEITPTTVLEEWVNGVIDFEARSKWRHPSKFPNPNPYPSSSFNTQSSSSSSSQRFSNQPGYNLVNEIAELAHRSKTNPKSTHRAGRLTDSDKRLLDLIEACYRCRTGWAGHRSTDPACPGISLEVPYRPPTANMMKKAIEIHKAKGCAITYNALLKACPDVPAVSSVSARPILDDISLLENLPSVPAAASVYAHPATAVMNPYGTFPVSSVMPDTALYSDSFMDPAHSTPVATPHVSSSVVPPKAPKAVASLVPRRGRWSDFVEQELLISKGEEENIRLAHAADSVRRRSLSESMSAGPSKRRRSDEGLVAAISDTQPSPAEVSIAAVSHDPGSSGDAGTDTTQTLT
ncbi:hypothetical protein EV361DRAFT_1011751 [Lentinula raphanica]|nr:hypothetical protein EV361DRAFT_1011751 [Lentinula raphanica]